MKYIPPVEPDAKRVFFLDLDGTLLNDEKEIPPENREAVRDVLTAGHRIVISSGRPLVSVQKQARRLELDGPGCYIIAYNGAVIYDCSGQSVIFEKTLEREDLYTLFDEARRRGIYIQTYEDSQVAVERGADTSITRFYCDSIKMDYHLVETVRDLTAPPVKALAVDFKGREVTDPFRQWINETLTDRVVSYFSSPYYLEIVPAGMNKGKAVRDVCGLLGIPVENAAALGDEANDIPMLREAGFGAAMANAAAEVKAAANYVTTLDNNHGGAAEAIRYALGLSG